MTKEKKNLIVKWIAFGILIAIAVTTFIFNEALFGPSSIFVTFTHENPIIQYICTSLPLNLIRSVQIIALAIALMVAIHYIAKITFKSKKGATISHLLISFGKWLVAIAAFFFVIGAWGADTKTMLVSAGVLTLVIGLGSQSLIADVLAGIFMVFEGDFQVGDIVIIDDWRGTVESIGIRTTKLVDWGGNVKIINNSEIRTLINQTKENSMAVCKISIGYGENLEKVEKIIKDNLGQIKENIPAIIDGPFYKGVAELGESSVVLQFMANCKEDDIYQVQRDLNRELKVLFDKNNINIPFNQLVVHMEDDQKEENK